MKKLLLSLALLLPLLLEAQEEQIIKLLNQALEKELLYQVKHRNKVSRALFVVEPFRISSDNKTLSFTVFVRDITGDAYELSQYVELDKILAISKDGNVFFETMPNAVLTYESTCKSGELVSGETNQFRLYLTGNGSNKKLQDKLVKAFKNAGYSINNG